MKKPVQMFVVTALLAGVAGCAVLTVDVDVYTGPLANTPEVQAEQVISLAMGAKPLLVQLRDHLEVSGRSSHALKTPGKGNDLSVKCPSFQDELVAFRSHDWYWAGFFAAGYGDDQRLKNEHAIRVNDILCLYEDRAPWDLAPVLERGSLAFDRYLRAYEVFRPTNVAAESNAWRRLKFQDSAGARALADAYHDLLVPNRVRDVGTEKRFERNSERLENAVECDVANHGRDKYRGEFRSNALFDYLEHGHVIERHAEVMFGPKDSDDRRLFVSRVQEIARAYTTSRTALRDMLRAALRGHEIACAVQFASKSQQRMIVAAVTDVIVTAMQPTILKNNANLLVADTDLRRTAEALPSLQHKRDYDQAATRLRQLLVSDTSGQVSSALLALDARLSEKEDFNLRFGLARGPTATEADFFSSPEMRRILSTLENAMDSALNGGRGTQGLETLIERYVEMSRTNRWFASRSQSDEFPHLIDSLVAFGQKMATLGNTAMLIDGGSSEEVKKYVRVLQYVGNTILVHVDELKQFAAHQDKLKHRTGWAADAVRTAGFTNQLKNNWVGSTSTNGFNAKDAIEQLTLALRAEHAQLLYQGAGPAKATAISSGTVLFSQPPTNPVVLTNLLSLQVSALTNTSSARLGADAASAAAAKPPPVPPALGELAAAEIELRSARDNELRITANTTEKRAAHDQAHNRLQAHLNDTTREKDSKTAQQKLTDAKRKLAELQTHLDEWQTAWKQADAALKTADSQWTAAQTGLTKAEADLKTAGAASTNAVNEFEKIENKKSPEATAAADAMHKAIAAEKAAKAKRAAAQATEKKAKETQEAAKKRLAAVTPKRNAAISPRDLAQKEVGEREAAAKAAKEAVDQAQTVAANLAAKAKRAAEELAKAETELKQAITRRETAQTRLATAVKAGQSAAKTATADTATSFALSVTNQIIAPGPQEKLKQAIEAVTEIREDMIYLRPAAAYLRSSFPASTANHSTVGWQNSLQRQAWRSIPVIGELFDSEGRAHQKILRELDKQSWQSVNRVRIAGAGDVNYVVAKDDIGNWYVKSYSADPSNMVRSVKNLAMFSAGGAFGGGRLPIKVGDKQTFAFTNLVFDSQLQQAVANYTQQTTNAFIQFTNDVTGLLPGKLVTAWKAGITDTNTLTRLEAAATNGQFTAKLKPKLDKADQAYREAATDQKAAVADDHTEKLLRAVVAYGAALQGDAGQVAEADRPKAKAAISSTVLSFVTDAARGRAEIITSFEESLGIIQAGAKQQSQALGQ